MQKFNPPKYTRTIAGAGCALAIAVGLFAYRANADEWNRRTVLSVGETMQIEDTVLPPGKVCTESCWIRRLTATLSRFSMERRKPCIRYGADRSRAANAQLQPVELNSNSGKRQPATRGLCAIGIIPGCVTR